MLRKLLKYDLRSVFKFWWILALTSVGLSAICGLCFNIFINITTTLPEPDNIVLLLLGMIVFYAGCFILAFGLAGFMIATMIFIFVRFYRNLYSDEGYFTFTIPASRSQLLLSKLIMAMLVMLAADAVLFLDAIVTVIVAATAAPDFWQILATWFRSAFEMIIANPILILYAIEVFLLFVVCQLFFVLLIFVCITTGATIVKKAKLWVGIGLFYAASLIVEFVTLYPGMFGIMSISIWLIEMPPVAGKAVLALILLCLTVFVAAAAWILYTLQLWMMDKKLNLT